MAMNDEHVRPQPPQSKEPLGPPAAPSDLQEDVLAAPGAPPSSLSPADFPNAQGPASVAAPPPAEHRAMVHSIHYQLSYLVRHSKRGPRGAIVLLHDLPGAPFPSPDVLPDPH